MWLRRRYHTIVLSDIHLGSEHTRTEEVTKFLKSVDCDVKDYLLETRLGRRYLVTHGDIFDTVTTHMRWLAMLGDMGYTFLLWLNKWYNRQRARRGKPYYSLSQEVKHRVKSAVSYISDFERELVRLAEMRHLDGVICGHIHQAADQWYGKDAAADLSL